MRLQPYSSYRHICCLLVFDKYPVSTLCYRDDPTHTTDTHMDCTNTPTNLRLMGCVFTLSVVWSWLIGQHINTQLHPMKRYLNNHTQYICVRPISACSYLFAYLFPYGGIFSGTYVPAFKLSKGEFIEVPILYKVMWCAHTGLRWFWRVAKNLKMGLNLFFLNIWNIFQCPLQCSLGSCRIEELIASSLWLV